MIGEGISRGTAKVEFATEKVEEKVEMVEMVLEDGTDRENGIEVGMIEETEEIEEDLGHLDVVHLETILALTTRDTIEETDTIEMVEMEEEEMGEETIEKKIEEVMMIERIGEEIEEEITQRIEEKIGVTVDLAPEATLLVILERTSRQTKEKMEEVDLMKKAHSTILDMMIIKIKELNTTIIIKLAPIATMAPCTKTHNPTIRMRALMNSLIHQMWVSKVDNNELLL